MDKIWHLMPKITEDFKNNYPEFSRVILQLLYNRNIKTKKEIEEYLSADYEKYIYDPFLFDNMEAAVNLIIKHIKDRNNIVVYGDFDADGVTASALLVEVLTILKGNAEVYIPERVSEGYGLNEEAVNLIAQSGSKLIITVDCGIRSSDEVEIAKKVNIDVLITDHHLPPEKKEDYPDCLIINPLVTGEKYPYKKLAGVGVAFKLAKALILKSKLSPKDKRKIEHRVLDLVAIGTVADCVSLFGENRTFLKKGLNVLNKTKRIGLQELIKVSSLGHGGLESWNIGFQIAPRLNAAGRMGHANSAYELLITKEKKEAVALAASLSEKNIERQNLTQEIIIEVEKQIDEENIPSLIIGVCPDNVKEKVENWNEGIIGLVAGRISKKYHRPTLVITKTQDGYKGSGRSIKNFNLINAIEANQELLEKFGGHPGACGFSLNKNNLEKFIKNISEFTDKKLKKTDLRPKIEIEHELKLSEINEGLMKEVDFFAPFGEDNDRPFFVSHNITILDIFYMGSENQHIKLKAKSDDSTALSAIGFSQAERWRDLIIGDKIDMVYNLELNNYNGRTEVQLKIIDIKKHNKKKDE